MQYTRLGKTNFRVSRLGFGGMRYPMKGNKVDRDLAIPLLRRAVELGVNYFDTAAEYCHSDSQRALGEAFEDIHDQVIIATKNPHYDKKDERGWWLNLENSLKRLRTDVIDVYKFHGVNCMRYRDHVEGKDGQIQWMLRAKEQGMIRHMAFSFHGTAELLKKIVSTGYFDVVTLQYNLLDRSNEPAFMYVADKCDMGIVVMGPLAGGRLGWPAEKIRKMVRGAKSVPEVALRFVLANPRVSVALSGMSNLQQLNENVRIASRKALLSATEKRGVNKALGRFKRLAELYCTGCNYCMPCPSGVNIPGNFTALNYDRVYGLKDHAIMEYSGKRLEVAQASYCVACGKCLSKCPQHIEIIKQLRETVRTLDHAYGRVGARLLPLSVKAFRKSRAGWRATIAAAMDLRNIGDEMAEIRIAANAPKGISVKPASWHGEIKSFGRRSVQLELDCRSNGSSHPIQTGIHVEGSAKVDLIGGKFWVGFAPRTNGSRSAALRRAPAIEIDRKEQIVTGTVRTLRRHGVTARFAYGDRALYIDADVQDDLMKPPAVGREPGVTDQLVLLFDPRPRATFGRPGRDSSVVMIQFMPPGPRDAPKSRVVIPSAADPALLESKSVRTSAGYRVRASISWKLFGMTRPVRKRLGLQLGLTSHGRNGRCHLDMHWTGVNSDFWKPHTFGHLFLMD